MAPKRSSANADQRGRSSRAAQIERDRGGDGPPAAGFDLHHGLRQRLAVARAQHHVRAFLRPAVSAMARPIPLLEPVTMAVFPCECAFQLNSGRQAMPA